MIDLKYKSRSLKYDFKVPKFKRPKDYTSPSMIDNTDNEDSPILCEHPTIILRKDWYKVFKKYRNAHIYTQDGEFDLHFGGLLDTMKYKLRSSRIIHNFSLIKDCVFYDDLGNTEPIYYVVPCGHCTFCRRKKTTELSFRCAAQSAYSTSTPLFITLTYDDAHKPSFGVVKTHLQNFFKRLRIRLDRLNIPHNLKYFAVSEYGSKTLRPHYHILLYNFPETYFGLQPQLRALNVIDFIQETWTTYHIKDNKRQQFADSRYIKQMVGTVDVKPVTEGCVGYVTKYMRKDTVIPEGQNPTWYTASKGLGADWIADNKEMILNNPHIQVLQCADQTGQIVNCPIIGYIKAKLLPTASVIMPRKQYENIQKFILLYYDLKSCALEIHKSRRSYSHFTDLYNRLDSFNLNPLASSEFRKTSYHYNSLDFNKEAFEQLYKECTIFYKEINQYPLDEYVIELDNVKNWKKTHFENVELSYNLKERKEYYADRDFSETLHLGKLIF